MAEAGFELTHLYGLTETYGPATLNEWHANGMICQPMSGLPSVPGRACVTSRSRNST